MMIQKLNIKTIFLFDGIGALASAFLTGVLLPLFSSSLGLPVEVLQTLAAFPVLYAIYSLSCYWLIKQPQRWMLMLIMVANLCYCLVSGGAIFGIASITNWGISFLIGEILVILAVVGLEWRVFRAS